MFSRIVFLVINCTIQTNALTDRISKLNQCGLYLAPSLTPGMGRGVFAGSSYSAGDLIMNSVTLFVSDAYTSGWQLNNYLWGTDEPSISVAEFGAGMLLNHKNPSSISNSWPSYFKISSEQELAHTISTSTPSIATRDIATGEELFVSYGEGNDWLQERGIFITLTAENDTYDAPVRSKEELQRIGICMTDVQIKKSQIPFAGKGLFAVRDFKKGDILTVSPTLILPKDGVADIGIGRHDVIQNYCIASPDVSNIVFFPFGLGAMANHAESDKANMKLQWYWWNEDEKERKMSTSAADLKAAQFAQLDIAYIALRDISEGEELTYNYGEAWAQSWMEHLARLSQWDIDAAIRETYEINHVIMPDQANLESSVKPKFLTFIESEDLFLPIWKAESTKLITEVERYDELAMADVKTEEFLLES